MELTSFIFASPEADTESGATRSLDQCSECMSLCYGGSSGTNCPRTNTLKSDARKYYESLHFLSEWHWYELTSADCHDRVEPELK